MDANQGSKPSAADSGFAPVDNELPLRWYRRLHLAPADGLGVGRRALFFAAVAWLPVAVWALMAGRLLDSDTGEPLLRHFGIHTRFLLAVPLFVFAEVMFDGTVKRMASNFVATGIVAPSQEPAFRKTLEDARRLRDSSVPWFFVAGVTLAWLLGNHPSVREDAYAWADAGNGTLGFGGWWLAYVARPIFVGLLLGWLWRMLLVSYCFWRIGRLELSLVPTHPDRAGGLHFVEKLPRAFAMVGFALSMVIVAHWAHEIVYHQADVKSFIHPAAAFAILWTVITLLPLLVLAPTLLATRTSAKSAYSKLVGEQGRLVHRRWILGEKIGEEPILDSPEIGPVADAAAIYEAVKNMRVVPIGKATLLSILVPIVLPMIAVAALQLPVKDMLLKLLKALA
jgi:hypothetical protein